MIVEKFGGRLPNNPGKLKSLPGIGLYTANAIAVFALDKSLPIVEANTARVLSRLFNIRAPIDSTSGRRKLWELSAKLVPRKSARDFQNAMMDLGALICTARNPRCQICPVKKFCRARDPASLPRKKRRAAIVPLTESHGLSIMAGAVLLERCSQRWRGMWMLPKVPAPRSAPIHTTRFPFTHHRVTLQVFRSKAARPASHQRWFPIRRLNKIPIPSPHRRTLTALLA